MDIRGKNPATTRAASRKQRQGCFGQEETHRRCSVEIEREDGTGYTPPSGEAALHGSSLMVCGSWLAHINKREAVRGRGEGRAVSGYQTREGRDRER